MDIIPISPPGAAVAPAVVAIPGATPVAPSTISQSIGVAVAPLVLAQPSTPGAIAPDVVDPGEPQSPAATTYVEPLPPDFEEFAVRGTYNQTDLINTSRYIGMFVSRPTTANDYVLNQSYYGAPPDMLKMTLLDGARYITVVNKESGSGPGGFHHGELSIVATNQVADPDPLYVVLGMSAVSDYNMPYNATGLAAAVDLARDMRPTLRLTSPGLRLHVSELSLLNCRLDGEWDLRGHSALLALRFYGCPSWSRVRLPANPGLEVAIEDVSATCDLDSSADSAPAWAEFFANLPDLSGQIGGVIVGPASIDYTDPDVGLLPPLWAASGAAAKNWTLI